MYKVGEFVIYGSEGVCEIEDISELTISEFSKKNNYYTLKPVHDNGKMFVPIDTNVFMRPIITYEEIQTVIKQIPLIERIDCSAMNYRVLQDYYKTLIRSHDCIDLFKLIINIDDKRTSLMQNRKKLNQIDEKFMKMATNLIEDEFSIVLGIPREKVEDYIKSKIM